MGRSKRSVDPFWFITEDEIHADDNFEKHSRDNEIIGVDAVEYEADYQDEVAHRIRREVPSSVDQTSIDPNYLPEWLNSLPPDYNPLHKVTQFFADLFHQPGIRAIRDIQNHLREAGVSIYERVGSVVAFGHTMSSVFASLNTRVTDVQRENDAQVKLIDAERTAMNQLHKKTLEAGAGFNQRMDFVEKGMDKILTKIDPALEKVRLGLMDVRRVETAWVSGIQRLLEGYLPPELVTTEMIEELVNHINDHILTQSAYSNYRLLSQTPSFYYQLKDIIYGRTERFIHITVRVPLYRMTGLVPVYRLDVFPVSVQSGMVFDPSKDGGYTILHNYPAYLAITDDLTFYTHLSLPQYLSCRAMGSSGIKLCYYGLPILQHKRHRNSCAYALFADDHPEIRETCEFRYTKKHPFPSAVQISDTGVFRMHSGTNKHLTWDLTCNSKKLPLQHIRACNCDKEIPCGCTLEAKHFYLGRRMTGCSNEISGGVPHVSQYNYRNFVAIQTWDPQKDLDLANSFATLTNRYYGNSYKFSPIEYHPDNFSRYVEESHKYSTRLVKAVQLAKQQTKVFAHRDQELLAKVRDFSNDVIMKSGSVSAALGDVVSGIFGNNIGLIISAIFAPFGMSLIAFLLSIFMFLPICVRYIMRRHRVAKEKKLVEDDEVELYSLLNNTAKYLCDSCIEACDGVSRKGAYGKMHTKFWEF
ncbi:PREDICTED: uncharacterized protein LOC109473300 [Branchiostoma belcheri]|uniref:Uncharacterized protein LOC109473300 n=1 Tax=Branchiostoma belcheri TaxID=7741 RepID=A0A6P4ZGE7_BRABE|nr:PREDICTED: uncharacterized protein LOC109473300 [Branchiostoma belcheri]